MSVGGAVGGRAEESEGQGGAAGSTRPAGRVPARRWHGQAASSSGRTVPTCRLPSRALRAPFGRWTCWNTIFFIQLIMSRSTLPIKGTRYGAWAMDP